MPIIQTGICLTSASVTIKNDSQLDAFEPADKRAFDLFLFITSTTFVVVSLMLFLWYRSNPHYSRLRVRSIWNPAMLVIGILIFNSVAILQTVVGSIYYPCVLAAWLSLSVVPFIGIAVLGHWINFVLINNFAEALSKYGKVTAAEQTLALEENNTTLLARILWDLAACVEALSLLVKPVGLTKDSTAQDRIRSLQVLRFATSTTGFFKMLSLFLIPFLVGALIVSFLADPALRAGCYGCTLIPLVAYIIIAQGATLHSIGVLVFVRSLKFKDPWGLKKQGDWMMRLLLFALVGFILSFFIKETSGAWDYNFITCFGFSAALGYSTLVQIFIARQQSFTNVASRRSKNGAVSGSRAQSQTVGASSEHSLYASESGVAPDLDKILRDPNLARMFEEFLTHELGIESLLFLQDTFEWKQNYYDVAPNARCARAKRLVLTFVDQERGLMPVNIPYHMIEDILKASPSQAQDVPVTLFDDARIEISKLLEVGAVARFNSSKEVMALQNETALVGGVMGKS